MVLGIYLIFSCIWNFKWIRWLCYNSEIWKISLLFCLFPANTSTRYIHKVSYDIYWTVFWLSVFRINHSISSYASPSKDQLISRLSNLPSLHFTLVSYLSVLFSLCVQMVADTSRLRTILCSWSSHMLRTYSKCFCARCVKHMHFWVKNSERNIRFLAYIHIHTKKYFLSSFSQSFV